MWSKYIQENSIKCNLVVGTFKIKLKEVRKALRTSKVKVAVVLVAEHEKREP